MAAREPPPPPPAPAEPDAAGRYEAVAPHWFYRKVTDTRERWVPFSAQDSERLEEAHSSGREKPPRSRGETPGTPSGTAALRLLPLLFLNCPLVLNTSSLLLKSLRGTGLVGRGGSIRCALGAALAARPRKFAGHVRGCRLGCRIFLWEC